MSALRWLWVAIAAAVMYAFHLIYAEIAHSPNLPSRLNVLVFAVLIAGVVIAAGAALAESYVKPLMYRLARLERLMERTGDEPTQPLRVVASVPVATVVDTRASAQVIALGRRLHQRITED